MMKIAPTMIMIKASTPITPPKMPTVFSELLSAEGKTSGTSVVSEVVVGVTGAGVVGNGHAQVES